MSFVLKHARTGRARAGSLVLLISILVGQSVRASSQPEPQDLKRLSLEQLMEIEVTVVTREPAPAGTAAAAISVITRDDIRRSGVTTIPDAIGLADGVHVARFNNGSWAISARGFNGSTPNKLLVMVDGRTEFSPLFNGVFWNIFDYVLEDIERIEVIRGPAGTLWGANAINGVVNIVTRTSHDTRGTLVSVGSGPEDPALVDVRYGRGSDALSYRIYGKFAQRDAQQFSTGGSSEDTRRRGQAGLRIDGSHQSHEWFVKADVFHSRDAFIDRRDGEWTEVAVQGRLNRKLSTDASLQVQSYYRREYRNIERQLTHALNTGDLDLQHAFTIARRNRFIWGAGYRVNADTTYSSPVIRLDPSSRTYPMVNVFAQNEMSVRPNVLSVTAGLKFEHNAFSGGDWQPNVRARWQLPRNQLLWGSIARAVRRPTRFDDDIRITAPSGIVLIEGNGRFESEVMTGWELGYRGRPASRLEFDGTVFVQDYDRLRSQEAPAVGVIPLTIANTLNGRSSGVELGATLLPVTWWRTHVSYTYLATSITRDATSRDVSGGVNERNDPDYLFTVRTGVDLKPNVQADAWLRRVAALPDPPVPAYTELNARVAWLPTPKCELSLSGQDLLHAQHPEFGTPIPQRIEFQRSIRVAVTMRLP